METVDDSHWPEEDLLEALDEFESDGDCGRLAEIVADAWRNLQKPSLGGGNWDEVFRVTTQLAEEEIASTNQRLDALLGTGTLEEAAQAAKEAVAQIRREFGWEDERYVIQLETLSAIYLRLGKTEEANDITRKAQFFRKQQASRQKHGDSANV